MDRVDKQRVMDLLRKAGLWEEADQYREEVRQRLREEGRGKAESVSQAWDEMTAKYEPLAEQSQPQFQTILPDGAERFEDIVDPDYQEADDAVQMRDAYRWIRDEFPRIVEDRPAGTVVDYRRFQTPPPVGLACNILETWASKPREKRDGLYREIRVSVGAVSVESNFTADSEPETCANEDDGGFMHLIGGGDE